MRKSLSLVLTVLLSVSGTSSAQAANKAGGSCTSLGAIVKIGSSKYECKYNKKSTKNVWTKIVKPAAFNCSTAKRTYPLAKETFGMLQDNWDLVKSFYTETDPFYIKTQKQIETAAADLKYVKDGIKRYC
jgi:hypothetical protein